MKNFLKTYWVSLLFGVLGVLQITPWVKIDLVAAIFFVLAALPVLLPLCSRHLKTLKAGTEGVEATFNPVDRFEPDKNPAEIEELPDRQKTPISDSDILAAFQTIPEFRDADLRKDLPGLKYYLLRNGVATKDQLERLVSSTDILDALRRLYIRVLKRDPARPLDPLAVAVWGSAFYVLGLNDEVTREIESRLRRSPEYREKVLRAARNP